MQRWWVAWVAWVAFVVACAAGGDTVSEEPRPGHTPAMGAVDPCDGKTCGDKCVAPDGAAGHCGLGGECGDFLGCACIGPQDCAPPPCETCPDGEEICPTVDCNSGSCWPGELRCGPSPGYDPCVDKNCGASCKLCDPALEACVEPSGSRACFAGSCTPSGQCTE